MNVDAVLAPAGDRRGCFEPVDGEVYATSTERAVPARGQGVGRRRGGKARGKDAARTAPTGRPPAPRSAVA